jgi:hypothetical protein
MENVGLEDIALLSKTIDGGLISPMFTRRARR